jgi:hypothetical protein
MKYACLLLGAILLLPVGCTTPPRPLETRLRLLQRGDRWLYQRRNMIHASDLTVQVVEVRELGPQGQELTVRLSWQENIEKRVPNPSRRNGYSYEVVGQRTAWQLQKLRQSQEGTLLWGGIAGASEYPAESGNLHPDDPNTGPEPLFLGLDPSVFSGDRRERTFSVASPHAGVESIQVAYKCVGVEPVTTALGVVQGLHISGVQTQAMRTGKTWKIPFEDWYDGRQLLLKRTFKVDDGSTVLGMKLMLGGTWILKEFQPALSK